jgi:RNA polymerase sigma-70 factor (ECF subfamily)
MSLSVHLTQEVTHLNSSALHSVQSTYRSDFNAAKSPAFNVDADIVELVRAGRTQCAFDLLLPRYRERVYRLALSILRDSATAEDATQDVFFRVWRALSGYNGNAALSTWIYAITRNTSISILRKRRAQISLDESSDDDGPALQLAAPEYDDSAVASVEKLLQHLPARYRQAVTLFYMEDKSYEQTAAALAVPLGTVKALLHRGRKRLIALASEAA